MKKFSVSLALLALALVLGLAFVGCGSNEEPKTIEDLFAKIKPFYTGGNMRAYKGDDTITYYVTHTAWEPFVWGVGGTHGAPPIFTLAEATSMEGWNYYTASP